MNKVQANGCIDDINARYNTKTEGYTTWMSYMKGLAGYFMTTSKRLPIPKPIQRSILTKNLGVCCVCKERGIGTNFHHIDGNPANNNEDNIAVLCVQEHDQHHRSNAYVRIKHLELGADKIKEYKREWEQTVEACKSNNPKILAVVNAYGDYTNIHAV